MWQFFALQPLPCRKEWSLPPHPASEVGESSSMEDRDPYGGCRRIQREPVFMLALKWLISFNSWQQLRNYSCFSCSCPAAVKLLPAVGVASCSFPVQMSSASSYTAMERAEGHFFSWNDGKMCSKQLHLCVGKEGSYEDLGQVIDSSLPHCSWLVKHCCRAGFLLAIPPKPLDHLPDLVFWLRYSYWMSV